MEKSSTLNDVQPSPSILQQGKLVLESLQYREEAARFHAARIDLQSAMLEAESGNIAPLESWLTTYRSLASENADLQRLVNQLSSIPAFNLPNTASTNAEHPRLVADSNDSNTLVSSTTPNEQSHRIDSRSESTRPSTPSFPSKPSTESDNLAEQVFTPATSPWQAMITGGLSRGTISHADLVSLSPNANCSTSTTSPISPLNNDPIAAFSPAVEIDSASTSTLTPPDFSPLQPDSDQPDPDHPTMAQIGLALEDELDKDHPETDESQENSLQTFAPPTSPGASTKAIQGSLKGLQHWRSKSPAFLISTGAHVIILLPLSIYVIRNAQPTELLAIVASPVEGEPIAMDAPLEMNPSDALEMTTSEMTTSTTPTVTTSINGGSAGDVSLPASMMGSLGTDGAGPALGGGGGIGEGIGAGTGIGSPTAGAQFYGVSAAGNTFCFIVDSSPSMKRDNAFAAAKQELLRSLSLMKPKQRFYIFFFGGEVERMALNGREPNEYPVYATPENLKKTMNWISQVKVQSKGKPPNDALDAAIELEPDGIFLLFDGDTRVDVAEHLRRTNRTNDLVSGVNIRVPIHTLGFYTDEYEDLMKRIAKENKGVYRFIPKPPKQTRDSK